MLISSYSKLFKDLYKLTLISILVCANATKQSFVRLLVVLNAEIVS